MSRDDLHTPPRSLAGLGSVLLFSGLFLLILCTIEAASGIRGMPRFWYVNRTMWWALSAASVAAGVWCLMPGGRAPATRWRPSRPGIRFRHVVVYTRAGCHLCDEALTLLGTYQRWLPLMTEVDIDRDAALSQKYGDCVPVVLCDGKLRFRGRVTAELLQRLIEGTPPLEAGTGTLASA